MVTDKKIKELQLLYKMRLRLAIEKIQRGENSLISLAQAKIYKGIVKDLKNLRGSLLR